jgi:phosphoribosylamine-glycine ligase
MHKEDKDCAHGTNHVFIANVARSNVTRFAALSGRVLRTIPIGGDSQDGARSNVVDVVASAEQAHR